MSNFAETRNQRRLRRDPNLPTFEKYVGWHDKTVEQLIRTYPKACSAREIATREIDVVEKKIETILQKRENGQKYISNSDAANNGNTSESYENPLLQRVFSLVNTLVVMTDGMYDISRMQDAYVEAALKIEENLEDIAGVRKNSAAYDLLMYWADLNRFLLVVKKS